MAHAHFILDTQSPRIYFYLYGPLGWSLSQHVAQSNITGYARGTLHADGSGSLLFVNLRVIPVTAAQRKLDIVSQSVSLPAVNQCADSSDVLCCT